MKKTCLLIGFLFFIKLSFSQIDTSSIVPKDTSLTAVEDSSFSSGDDGFSFFFTDEERSKFLNYKPILGIGVGVIKYYGDVKDVYISNPVMGNKAINFSVSRDFNDYLAGHFIIFYGNLSGNARSENFNFNFKTDALDGALMLSYNFYHFLHKPDLLIPYRDQRKLIPVFSLGLSAFNFLSKADMTDAYGNTYYYWSDGSIRNKEESEANDYSSVILQRDYQYETDLRELDLDGLGKYNKTAFSIPIDFALELNLHKHAVLKMGATYYWTWNDNVDNISSVGEGNRKGNAMGDNFLYSYLTLKLDLFSDEKEVDENTFFFVKSEVVDAIKVSDEDNDGVSDVWDECLETPENIPVDAKGCPIDTDNDGIPDYRDDEINTEKDSIVNLKGVKLTDEEWAYYSDTTRPAIDYDQICTTYPSLCYNNEKERYRNSSTEIPDKFKYIDKDKDGYLSVEEIGDAIDDFFNMASPLKIEDVYELTQFFFTQ